MKKAKVMPNPAKGSKAKKSAKYKNSPSKIKHSPRSGKDGTEYKGRYV